VATELELIGKQLLQTFPKATRASIFTRATNTSPLQETWHNARSSQELGMDGDRILGTVEKWKRTVLVEDARSHKLLQNIQKHHFHSCLAVPILDNSRFLKGLIYLTSQSPGTFNTHGRFACEKIAQQSVTILLNQDEKLVDGESPNLPSPSSIFSPRVLVASLTLILVVGLFLALVKGGENQTPGLSSRTAPREAAKDFLQHLRVGEFHQAWEMLEPSFQQKWPRELFQENLKAWTDQEGHQMILLTRDLNGIEILDDGHATATLLPTSLEHDDGRKWSWELREGERSWLVADISGGPVEHP